MSITQVRMSNFKSFGAGAGIDLRQLNVLVGANASGKSNFVDAFKFLRNLAREGLDNALSYIGGIECLKNLRSRPSEPVELGVVLERTYHGRSLRVDWVGTIEIEISRSAYNLGLLPHNGDQRSALEVDESIVHDAKVKVVCSEYPQAPPDAWWNGEIRILNRNGAISFEPASIKVAPAIAIPTNLLFNPFFVSDEAGSKDLLIQNKLNFFGQHFLDDIGIYDFDPSLARDPVWGPGPSELEEDGENLAVALKPILQDEEKKRKFLNLMSYILPSVSEMKTVAYPDGSVLPAFSETYSPEFWLPATVMSDGTISVTNLVVALYFMDTTLAIVEEPDKNVHPSLASSMMSLVKEVAAHKQIIVTTHNQELVRHVHPLEDLLLVSRDKSGNSKISRPSEETDINSFLSEELGIADLFVSNLLGG